MQRFIIPFAFVFLGLFYYSMANNQAVSNQMEYADTLTVMSYNVENLFDTINNALTDDDAFTPEGEMKWTKRRYRTKLERLARVISRVGGRSWPDIVCLVEVENATVIKDLLHYTPLGRKGAYRFVITHSPDPRGVDVAILYRPKQVNLLGQKEYAVHFTSDANRKSRNVLELCFVLPNGDKLYVMGVHWPSRREGAEATEPLRCDVARLMRQRCDSLYQELEVEERGKTHFLLMGDFNEEDNEMAIQTELKAQRVLPQEDGICKPELMLYSLMNPEIERGQRPKQPYGSYCFQQVWTQLDHFILSESLFKAHSRVQYRRGSAQNYYAPFLASPQEVAGFRTPYRTYAGPHYIGGYSDHYPIRLSLRLGRE